MFSSLTLLPFEGCEERQTPLFNPFPVFPLVLHPFAEVDSSLPPKAQAFGRWGGCLLVPSTCTGGDSSLRTPLALLTTIAPRVRGPRRYQEFQSPLSRPSRMGSPPEWLRSDCLLKSRSSSERRRYHLAIGVRDRRRVVLLLRPDWVSAHITDSLLTRFASSSHSAFCLFGSFATLAADV